MKVYNLLWWSIYTVLAIALQGFVAGVDMLLPAYLIAIQEGNKKQIIWVGVFYIFIQEGIGASLFGISLLRYILVLLCFVYTRRFFQPDNFTFVFLLSAFVGISNFIILYIFTDLQNLSYQHLFLLKESIYQFLLTPLIWRVATFTRRRIRDELFA